MPFLFFYIIIPFFFSSFETPKKGQLQIEIKNIQENKGIIWVGIYDSEADFMIKEKAIILGASPKKPFLKINDLPFGSYAIAIFHDINNNGDLDLNKIGIPAEPFGFSKKPVSKWRIPKFHEIKFNFHFSDQKVNISLSKWSLFN